MSLRSPQEEFLDSYTITINNREFIWNTTADTANAMHYQMMDFLMAIARYSNTEVELPNGVYEHMNLRKTAA